MQLPTTIFSLRFNDSFSYYLVLVMMHEYSLRVMLIAFRSYCMDSLLRLAGVTANASHGNKSAVKGSGLLSTFDVIVLHINEISMSKKTLT